MTCSVVDCTSSVLARALCSKHYQRFMRHGSIDLPPPRRAQPKALADRFWAATQPGLGSECWQWGGPATRNGYGSLSVGPKGKARRVMAHRLAYELLVGPIPEGLVIDHLCRNRSCVNPAHLEPVTNAENIRRGFAYSAVNRRKTHCINGHPFDDRNTSLFVREGSLRRRCKACCRERSRAARRESAA